MTTIRPAIVTDEHLQYLDELREGGTINMWGAASFLESDFDLSQEDAKAVLMYWMRSFGERHIVARRL
jgi:hypothetical protein